MGYKTIFPKILRTDIHYHVARRTALDTFISIEKTRELTLKNCNADIALIVDLDGGVMTNWVQDPERGYTRLKNNAKGRIIPVLSESKPAQGIVSFKPNEIARLKSARYNGLKMHWQAAFNGGKNAKYGLINDKYFEPFFKELERNNMPLVCLHLEAPWGKMIEQRAALCDVLATYPNLNIIHAHFGAQRWRSLDEHAKIFDDFPNYYRDISTTAQHLTVVYSYKEARDFFIKYNDRLLYGTDNICSHRADIIPNPNVRAKKYELQFEWLETDNNVRTRGIGMVNENTPEFIKGLNLPERALRNIYFNNTVRLLPWAKTSLLELNYPSSIFDNTPTPTPTPTPPLAPPLPPITSINISNSTIQKPKTSTSSNTTSLDQNKMETFIDTISKINQNDIKNINQEQKATIINQLFRIIRLLINTK